MNGWWAGNQRWDAGSNSNIGKSVTQMGRKATPPSTPPSWRSGIDYLVRDSSDPVPVSVTPGQLHAQVPGRGVDANFPFGKVP